MVKRKVKNTSGRNNRPIISTSESSLFDNKFQLDDNQISKERKKQDIIYCSTSSSSCCSNEYFPSKKRKVYTAKHIKCSGTKPKSKSSKSKSEHSKKTENKVMNLKSGLINKSTRCRSCESLASVDLLSTNTKGRPKESTTDIEISKSVGPYECPQDSLGIADLKGMKFVGRKDLSGPPIEITFNTALLMHVKESKAVTDFRPESYRSQETVVKEIEPVNHIKDLMSKMSVGSGSAYRSSFNVPTITVCSNCSKTKDNILNVKSSHNFTDLDLQRRLCKNVKNRSSCSLRHDDLRVILPPQYMQNSCNSLLNSKLMLVKTRNSGDQLSLDSFVSYNQLSQPSDHLSHQHISLLHIRRTERNSLNRDFKLCSSNSIALQHAASNSITVIHDNFHSDEGNMEQF